MRRLFKFVLGATIVVSGLLFDISTAYGSEPRPLNLNPTVVIDRSLRSGCKGKDVWWLQYVLSDLGYDLGDCGCDGVYGEDTKQAVRYFQRDNDIKQSGTVDNATITALTELSNTDVLYQSTISRGKITSREFELMCMVVYREARGEPFEGQVAVAEVILTRVRSPHFPDTISEVVFQPDAFTGFNGNHSYNEESISAVEQAFTGTVYSNGADHFCDLNACSPSWAKDQYLVAHIEGHWFYNLHQEEE